MDSDQPKTEEEFLSRPLDHGSLSFCSNSETEQIPRGLDKQILCHLEKITP